MATEESLLEAVRLTYEDAALLAYGYKETDLDTRGSWRENIGAAIRARGIAVAGGNNLTPFRDGYEQLQGVMVLERAYHDEQRKRQRDEVVRLNRIIDRLISCRGGTL